LNTLGGALAINTKNGKDFPGGSITLLGGSFGRGALNTEYGGVDDAHNLDYFVSINKDYQDGWRDHSKSDVQQLFGKLRWHSLDAKNNLELSIALADNTLNGTQGLPISMLDNPKQAYTWPDHIGNRMAMINLKASSWLSDTRYIAANAYYRKSDSNSMNSNAQYDDNCDSVGSGIGKGKGTGCDKYISNGTAYDYYSLGTYASNFTSGGYLDGSGHYISRGGIASYGSRVNTSNVYSDTNQDTIGSSVQYSVFDKFFGRNNSLTSGAVVDHSNIKFIQNTMLARLVNYQTITIPDTKYLLSDGSFHDGLLRNVHLTGKANNFSLFLTDNFEVTDKFNITASGSYNVALLKQSGSNTQYLNDDGGYSWTDAISGLSYSNGDFNNGRRANSSGTTSIGAVTNNLEVTSLNGSHHFNRFNPSVGFNFNPVTNLGFFAGYSESMRAPTLLELSCADKNHPCNMPTGFNGDPDLKEVVAKTWEAGARGKFIDTKLNWNAAVYNSYNFNDIQFISASPTTGYFQNVGKTRRTGFELGINTKLDKLLIAASYGYVDATFRSSFDVNAEANSTADNNNQIHVNKGNKIPGIADQTLKLRAAYDITSSWNVGSNVMFASGQYAHGDENNQDVNGKVPGYGIMNLDTRYQFNNNWTVFGLVNNVFDKAYATYGLVGTNIYNNSYEQFRTPATERAGWLGVTYSFGGAKKTNIDKD
jgi:outer membrane receptor protein involved in Fe transport